MILVVSALPNITFDDIYNDLFDGGIVDICKMDVEGAEFEIIESGTCEKLSSCRYLLIEIHHETDRPRARVISKLKDIGFQEIDGESKTDDKHYVHFFKNVESL